MQRNLFLFSLLSLSIHLLLLHSLALRSVDTTVLDYFDAAVLKMRKTLRLSTTINSMASSSKLSNTFLTQGVHADARPPHCPQDHTFDNLKLNEVVVHNIPTIWVQSTPRPWSLVGSSPLHNPR